MQILNISYHSTATLLFTKLCEFLDHGIESIDVLAVADIMEFLCIVENNFLVVGGSHVDRTLVEVSEDSLWWCILDHLLDHICSLPSLSPLIVSRMVVCMMNILATLVGVRDMLLIDRACLDELHSLSVFEQQAADVDAPSGNVFCKVASKLLEYRLINLPLVSVHCEELTDFSSQGVCKVVDMLKAMCRRIAADELSDILAHGQCQQLVGVTWLHPFVMWSIRQKIFIHCYHKLSMICQDVSISDKLVSLCDTLKPLANDIDQLTATSAKLQEDPKYQFERNLFIIRHQLDGSEGD